MVAADLEEVKVPETQAEALPDTPAPSATESPEPSPEDALKAFEAEIGLETQDAEQAKGEPEAQNPPAQKDDDAEVERKVQAKLAEDNRIRQENGVRQAYATRTQNLRNVLTQVAMGQRAVDLNLVNWVVDQFNAHNADASRFAGDGLANLWTGTLLDSAKKHAKMADRYDSTDAIVTDLVGKAREGYVSKRDHDAAVKAAGVAVYNKLKASPAAVRALLSQIEGASGSGGGGVSALPTGPITAEMAATLPLETLTKLKAAGRL